MSMPPRTCTRCRQPLPEGSSYCVACGCTNESVDNEKIATIAKQAEARKNWEAACRVFPFLRWFQ
jgi:hypothetical protein